MLLHFDVLKYIHLLFFELAIQEWHIFFKYNVCNWWHYYKHHSQHSSFYASISHKRYVIIESTALSIIRATTLFPKSPYFMINTSFFDTYKYEQMYWIVFGYKRMDQWITEDKWVLRMEWFWSAALIFMKRLWGRHEACFGRMISNKKIWKYSFIGTPMVISL